MLYCCGHGISSLPCISILAFVPSFSSENLGISKTVLLFRVLLKFCRFCPVPGIVSFRRILSQTKNKTKTEKRVEKKKGSEKGVEGRTERDSLKRVLSTKKNIKIQMKKQKHGEGDATSCLCWANSRHILCSSSNTGTTVVMT